MLYTALSYSVYNQTLPVAKFQRELFSLSKSDLSMVCTLSDTGVRLELRLFFAAAQFTPLPQKKEEQEEKEMIKTVSMLIFKGNSKTL